MRHRQPYFCRNVVGQSGGVTAGNSPGQQGGGQDCRTEGPEDIPPPVPEVGPIDFPPAGRPAEPEERLQTSRSAGHANPPAMPISGLPVSDYRLTPRESIPPGILPPLTHCTTSTRSWNSTPPTLWDTSDRQVSQWAMVSPPGPRSPRPHLQRPHGQQSRRPRLPHLHVGRKRGRRPPLCTCGFPRALPGISA